MEKKLPKIYFIYYNLLIVQGLWQAHYQILLILFLKEFIELTIFFMGEGKFYPAKTFLLILKTYGKPSTCRNFSWNQI